MENVLLLTTFKDELEGDKSNDEHSPPSDCQVPTKESAEGTTHPGKKENTQFRHPGSVSEKTIGEPEMLETIVTENVELPQLTFEHVSTTECGPANVALNDQVSTQIPH